MRILMDDVGSIVCDRCGDGVSSHNVCEMDGKEICMACHDAFETWIEAGV